MEELDLNTKYNRHSNTRIGACRFRLGIECDALTLCAFCGWNPETEKTRKEKNRATLVIKKPEREHWLIGRGPFPGKMA